MTEESKFMAYKDAFKKFCLTKYSIDELKPIVKEIENIFSKYAVGKNTTYAYFLSDLISSYFEYTANDMIKDDYKNYMQVMGKDVDSSLN